ncbi:MAG: hypothetical protein M1832_004357, partial [Thelocarpon impressellum]
PPPRARSIVAPSPPRPRCSARRAARSPSPGAVYRRSRPRRPPSCALTLVVRTPWSLTTTMATTLRPTTLRPTTTTTWRTIVKPATRTALKRTKRAS